MPKVDPATTRLEFHPTIGVPPSLEFRKLDELGVDDSYQRSLETEPSVRLIRRIAQHWDWGLCQPLAVARRADGTLMVVDGQHRLAAARLRKDIPHLPCVITSFDSPGAEAAAFVALNQQRRPLHPLDLFKASLAAKDADALVVHRMMTEAGLALAPHTNWKFWKPGMVANVGAMLKAYNLHGGTVLRTVLKALAGGFEGKQLRYAGTLFNALLPVAAKHLKAGANADRLADQLVATLAQRDQADWISAFRSEHARSMCTWPTAGEIVVSRHFLQGSLPGIAAVAVDADPQHRIWCSQCERRVSDAAAFACKDRFCKAKQEAA